MDFDGLCAAMWCAAKKTLPVRAEASEFGNIGSAPVGHNGSGPVRGSVSAIAREITFCASGKPGYGAYRGSLEAIRNAGLTPPRLSTPIRGSRRDPGVHTNKFPARCRG